MEQLNKMVRPPHLVRDTEGDVGNCFSQADAPWQEDGDYSSVFADEAICLDNACGIWRRYSCCAVKL